MVACLDSGAAGVIGGLLSTGIACRVVGCTVLAVPLAVPFMSRAVLLLDERPSLVPAAVGNVLAVALLSSAGEDDELTVVAVQLLRC